MSIALYLNIILILNTYILLLGIDPKLGLWYIVNIPTQANTIHWNLDLHWHVHCSGHVRKTLTDVDTQGQPKPLCEMLQQPVAISSMLQFP